MDIVSIINIRVQLHNLSGVTHLTTHWRCVIANDLVAARGRSHLYRVHHDRIPVFLLLQIGKAKAKWP